MALLELPEKVFHKILLYTTIARGVTRGLRLKLVCKKFHSCLNRALFESRLLDEFWVENATRWTDLDLMEAWYIRRHHGADKFWQSYIAYCVLNETNPKIGRYVEMRQLAVEFCRQTNADYQVTIDTICLLALENHTTYPGRLWDTWRGSCGPRPIALVLNPGLNLLSIAAYLNNLPFARLLLEKGHSPTANNDLFPPPMQLAAWAGNADMLKLFQEHLPDFQHIQNPPPGEKEWQGKTGPGSIQGAALRGDMEMLRLAMYPPSRSIKDMNFAGKPLGDVRTTPNQPGYELHAALFNSKTWEMFHYLFSCISKEEEQYQDLLIYFLARYTNLGNLEIVKNLLDLGVDVHGARRVNGNPLLIALRYGYEDIVNLLLDSGSDPNNADMQQRGSPLCAAACLGSIAMVQKLFDHGANFNSWGRYILYHAVHLEHTDMVNLLFEKGVANTEDDFGDWILNVAEWEGLESMVELLQSWGMRRVSKWTEMPRMPWRGY